MEEINMEVCPICGITRKEQEFQQQLVSVEFHMLRERWEQHHEPNELPPGFPLTQEHRVHFALLLYENDSSMDSTLLALMRAAREAGADHNAVIRALSAKKTNEKGAGLPLTDDERVRYALLLLEQNDSAEKPSDAAIALVARKVRVDPDLVVKALTHANGA
ncbi:MAG TPA: hypothetical protein VIX20_15060 [Ktedonobacteraceae bacterium]